MNVPRGSGTHLPPWAALVLSGLLMTSAPARADDWPQWRGPNRDGVWNEKGLVEDFSGEQLKLRWRVPISSGYSGPTVADGRVFVTDRVREPQEAERVLCFAWGTGRKLWTYLYPCEYVRIGYPAGPRASVTIDDGRAYVLGSMGHLHCLDAADGRVIWKKTPAVDYQLRVPIWGVAAAPLVEGDLLIVQIGATNGGCLVAWDKTTGQLRWRALDDKASYSAPIVIEQAGRRVLVCWTGANVVGLNPASGDVYWKYPFLPKKMIINVPTPVVEGNRLFLTGFYDGALMLRLDPNRLRVEKVWRRRGLSETQTDALHAMIATPYMQGDYVYGVDSYGELRCLQAETGNRVWEDLTATPKARWSNIHMVRNGRRLWMFNERGELIICTL